MQNLNTSELTQYLKQAAELESSVYRQETSRSSAKSALRKETPYKPYVEKPKNPVDMIEVPTPPVPYVSMAKMNALFCICGPIFLVFGIVSEVIFFTLCGLFICVVGGLGIGVSATEKKAKKQQYEQYEKQLAEYNRKVAVAEAEYHKQIAIYEKELREQDNQYQAACTLADKRYLIASNEISKMDAPLEETKVLLEKLYSIDIIFPKYRNMVAMCTMYEYFVTGRCSELTGPNGAYNLYEAELRQNLIIDKLDTIVRRLDQIAQNQFTLYQELRKTNEIVSGIANDVKTLCKTTERIAEASTITAQCAYITAQNTEALKYITLING